MGNEAGGWKLRFPEAGCFGHVSSRHFRGAVEFPKQAGEREREKERKQNGYAAQKHLFGV